MTIDETLAEIRTAIDAITTWTPVVDANLNDRGAYAWVGFSDGWRLLVCAWPLAGGSEGADGTAVCFSSYQIVHLTPELAAMAAKKAKGTP